MNTRPAPRPVPERLRHRATSPFQLSMRAVLRSLPMVSTIRPGQRQGWALRDLVFGRALPCWTLEQAIDDLIARAESRADAESVRLLATHLDHEIAARIDAKFGPLPAPDFREATLAETRAQAELDALQVEAGLTPSPALCDRIVAAGRRKIEAVQHMVGAAARRAALSASSLRGVS